MRAGRLLDNYLELSGPSVTPWREIVEEGGLSTVPANMFLRPCSEGLVSLENIRTQRLTRAIEAAARQKGVFHLWWHPHNFGVRTEQNLAKLREICQAFARMRDQFGMRSLTMCETAEIASGRMTMAA